MHPIMPRSVQAPTDARARLPRRDRGRTSPRHHHVRTDPVDLQRDPPPVHPPHQPRRPRRPRRGSDLGRYCGAGSDGRWMSGQNLQATCGVSAGWRAVCRSSCRADRRRGREANGRRSATPPCPGGTSKCHSATGRPESRRRSRTRSSRSWPSAHRSRCVQARPPAQDLGMQ